MKSIFVLVLAAFAMCTAQAQQVTPTSLYVPTDFQRAYQKGTRSWDGKPGPNYWQNHSSYKIKASLDPKTRKVTGEQTVTYTNNSPDTLRVIVLRTYANALRKGAARDEGISPEDVGDGLVFNKLSVNGAAVKPADQGSNQIIRLPSPLGPKQQLTLDAAWTVVMPTQSGTRQGTYADSSFFVAYWYPEIAVYDDVHGWDQIPFEGIVEFYNDFSDFDVELTVPRNYLVWATGSFQNPDEVLAEPYLARYKQATVSNEVVKIITPDDLPKRNFTKGTGSTVWRFKQERVSAFAFASSSTYLWDASSVVVDSAAKRSVVVGAAYQPTSKDYYDVAQFSRESVWYLSHKLPGVPFPFPSVTVFNGEGGMEHPGMVNNGSFPSAEVAAEVAAHELAHMYFPFYMGINEKRYAWMDEGFAQFLPNLYEFTNPQTKAKFQVQYNVLARAYSQSAGRSNEFPLLVPTYVLAGSYPAIGVHSYYRPGNMYTMLQDLLGPAEFKRVLQEYMRRWNGKHPIPYDFFQTFNTVSGQNLDWFFQPWAAAFGAPDLAVSAAPAKKGSTVTVTRKGIIPVPVHLVVTYTDGTTETIHETAAAWKTGATTWTKILAKPVQKVTLGDVWIPDNNPTDNTWTAK